MSARATDQHLLGLLAVTATVICWGSGNVMVRDVALPGIQLAFWRLGLTTVIYLGIFIVQRRRMTLSQLVVCLPSAIFTGLWLITFYAALKSTTVTNVAMVASLVPIVTMWSAVRRFGESISITLVGLVVCALGGTALVLFGSASVTTWSLRGDALALMSMLLFSANFVFAKEARQKVGALEFQAVVWTIAFVVVSPVASLVGEDLYVPPLDVWAWIIALIAVPGSGHLMMNWAHRHVRLTVSSTALLGAPPISMIGAALFLDEPIKLIHVLGGAIVIASVAAVIRRDLQLNARHPEPLS